jgi:hypothetical protein
MRAAFSAPSSVLPAGSGDTDNLRFRGLTAAAPLRPLSDSGGSSSSVWTNSLYKFFRASGASLWASYFSSLCTKRLVLRDCEMDESAEESAPLRAIDCTKRRLSSGVYCIAMEGIPCSTAYLTSLDLDRATGRQRQTTATGRQRLDDSDWTTATGRQRLDDSDWTTATGRQRLDDSDWTTATGRQRRDRELSALSIHEIHSVSLSM